MTNINLSFDLIKIVTKLTKLIKVKLSSFVLVIDYVVIIIYTFEDNKQLIVSCPLGFIGFFNHKYYILDKVMMVIMVMLIVIIKALFMLGVFIANFI